MERVITVSVGGTDGLHKGTLMTVFGGGGSEAGAVWPRHGIKGLARCPASPCS